ncbi:outer membrane protein assembly factor BamE [Cupriavidus sp. AU9028]|uniref:outer membrane protein assembly factor BamE n=1 Tax=Cupriavidus sp. AU9028 TaxID=2871157 RepID=UPI001C95A821|nr:outer membrane protein assembly factor BamE [Cupriavidus sp. AU9028]MBY4896179.1 outer membrane protein assembly factor BamE [Cupriavidus sp. AU9028]
MFDSMKRHAAPLTGLLAALMLGGCGNLSRIDDRGASASPVWPAMDETTMTLREGIHPDPARLALVKPGMTKDQLYHLLGRPHFLEGFFFVREWDYLFHLQTPSGDKACQYKVLFDRDMRAQQFLWREQACADAATALSAAAAGSKPGA